MAVLLTGGTGFVGLNFAQALVERGEEVVFFDQRLPPAQFLAVLRSSATQIFTRIGDVRNRQEVESVFTDFKITHVFLGAAITAGREREIADPFSILEVNLIANVHIFQVCAQAEVKRILFPSSLSVYGQSLHDRELVNEAQTPLVPEGLYAISKYAAERTVLRLGELLQIEVVAGRIGAVFGPWEGETGVRDLVSAFAQIAAHAVHEKPVILPPKFPKREMIYSCDLAQALIRLMFAERLSAQVYNLSENSDWLQAPEVWCAALQRHFPHFEWRHAADHNQANIRYFDMRDRAGLDTSRLKNDLGFMTRYPMPLAMAHYAKWLDLNRSFLI